VEKKAFKFYLNVKFADCLIVVAHLAWQDKASLNSQVNAQVIMLSTRNAENDELKDEIERLKQDIYDMESELQRKETGSRFGEALGGIDREKNQDEFEDVRFLYISALLVGVFAWVPLTALACL
jgi:hypothetical protein